MALTKDTEIRFCPICHGRIPFDTPEGNCPNCLLTFAVSSALQPSDDDADGAPLDEPDSKIERSQSPRTDFGDYELLGEIARGGMGVVYKAHQKKLNRQVAIKMIHGGNLSTTRLIDRFKFEARAAARLDHPNIVPVHEIGEIEGQHYFTMKFFEKGTLLDQMSDFELAQNADSYSRRQNGIRSRELEIARLMAAIARAVQYAHQRGVMHRDLKPSNILLDESGQPHVSDFSLAKLTEEESGLTLSGVVLGTPSYMAPEQAAGNVRELTTAVDIYGLGAIFYHLLTGRPPFVAEARLEVLRMVTEEDPVAPSRICSGIDEDLETICLHCLEKAPHQRYGSALEVAEDLERFTRGEPIRARPVSVPERFKRWCQRRPVIAGFTFALALAITCGFSVSVWQWRKAELSRRETQKALVELNSRLVDTRVEQDNVSEALLYLSETLRADPHSIVAASRAISILERFNFPLPIVPPIQAERSVRKAIFSPDGTTLAAICGDTERVWVWGSRSRIVKTREPLTVPEYVRIYDVRTGQPLTDPLPHDEYIHDVSFSPDGSLLATASWDKTTKIWDVNTGELLFELIHDDIVWSAKFDPDGSRLLTSSDTRAAHIWDVQTGRLLSQTPPSKSHKRYAEFSPDGRRILTAARQAALWEAESLQPLIRFSGHLEQVDLARFSPDGTRVLTASWDGMARIFDAGTGELLIRPAQHNMRVTQARFSADGRRFATASADQTARVWNAENGQALTPAMEHEGWVWDVRFSLNGQKLASASWDHTARIWNAFTGEPLSRPIPHHDRVWSAEFSHNGEHLLTASHNGRATVWEVALGQAFPEPTPSSPNVSGIKAQHSAMVLRRIYGGGRHPRIWIEDAKTLAKIAGPIEHGAEILAAEFSPDGHSIVTSGVQGFVRVWDTATLRESTPPFAHDGAAVGHVGFSPDGSRLVTGSVDGVIRVWDLNTGQVVVGPLFEQRPVLAVCFSPDGRLLATGSEDRTARIWDAETGIARTAPLKHNHWVGVVRFSPDSSRLVTGSSDNTARIWDVASGLPLSEWLPVDLWASDAAFSQDGDSFRLGYVDGFAWKHDLPIPPLPAPGWFAALVESVGGQRRVSDGTTENVPLSELWAMKRRILESKSIDFYTRWAQWFFADRAQRPVSAWSSMSKEEFFQFCINEHHVRRKVTVKNPRWLEYAIAWAPTNGLAYARLAQQQPASPAAEWYSLQAVTLQPDNAECWWSRAGILNRLGRYSEGLMAIDRTIQLDPGNSNYSQLRRESEQINGVSEN